MQKPNRPPTARNTPAMDRPSEDDLAREQLGGVKGSPELPPAPLTPQDAEQTLPTDEPGHTV